MIEKIILLINATSYGYMRAQGADIPENAVPDLLTYLGLFTVGRAVIREEKAFWNNEVEGKQCWVKFANEFADAALAYQALTLYSFGAGYALGKLGL